MQRQYAAQYASLVALPIAPYRVDFQRRSSILGNPHDKPRRMILDEDRLEMLFL